MDPRRGPGGTKLLLTGQDLDQERRKREKLRKKSHILLGRYLAAQMSEVYSLQQHRKAFCLGNIMPDLKPSFLTTRHEFFGTFDHLQNKMRALVEKNPEEENARVYWRRFGEVMHYMADYFTFPHNKTYKGNLAAHNSYEAELKNRLRECILSGAADSQLEEAKQFESFEELVEYIRERHAYYLESPRCIADDIRFILRVCYQVVQGIFQLCVRKQFHMGGQPAVTV